MLLFLPVSINALYQRRPLANWAILAVTTSVSLWVLASMAPDGSLPEPCSRFVLFGWNPAGLLGHLLVHGDLIHLAGNMLFLWVFGNALCANMNNFLYLGLYVVFGLAAAAAHLVFDGAPAIGASGAINGVVGLALAIYPRDEVDIFYLFVVKGGTFQLPVWVLALVWLGFDVWGAAGGGGSVAYFAHLGGLAAGVVLGLVLLHFDQVDLTIHDRQTLLEFLKGERPD